MRKVSMVLISLLLVSCASTPRTAEQEQTLRIYLARHGQTDWNLARRFQGQTDTELNDTGRKQAAELATRVETIGFQKIYSSALRRSRDTARVAARGAAVESLASLNEQALGQFEGLYLDGRDKAREEEYERRSKLDDDSLDGGESRQQFFSRVCSAVSDIRRTNRSGSILIVGHGGTNTMILRCLLELTAEQAAAIRQSNDELYLVEITTGRSPRLWKWIARDQLNQL